MRIVHISDLHIGLKINNRDLKEDQEYILHQIVEKAVEVHPDVMLIAGDIYDKSVPSAEAMEVFDHFMAELVESLPTMKVMMISGNHDNALRINQYRRILKGQGVYAVGLPPQQPGEHIECVTLEDVYGPVNFYLLPFVKPSMVKSVVGVDENGLNLSYDASIHKLLELEDIDQSQRNVFVSHQFYLPVGQSAEEVERMDSEIRTVGNIDEVRADVLKEFDYVALGHIHKPMKVGSDVIRYVGTPLACSVSEAEQQKQMLQIDLKEKGQVDITSIPLEPLRQVRIIKGTLQEVLQKACQDYVTVVLTDEVDFNVLDMQEQVRGHFPNLIEIRRENLRYANYDQEVQRVEDMDPMELCMSFFEQVDDASKQVLLDVIHQVKEVL